jgi:hypothetical protein
MTSIGMWAKSGRRGILTPAPHTTGHAGPRPAVPVRLTASGCPPSAMQSDPVGSSEGFHASHQPPLNPLGLPASSRVAVTTGSNSFRPVQPFPDRETLRGVSPARISRYYGLC